MTSATAGSIGSLWATARRSARYTSFGRRARCASSLNVREPNSSVALRLAPAVPFDERFQLLMLRIVSPADAEPINGRPFFSDHWMIAGRHEKNRGRLKEGIMRSGRPRLQI